MAHAFARIAEGGRAKVKEVKSIKSTRIVDKQSCYAVQCACMSDCSSGQCTSVCSSGQYVCLSVCLADCLSVCLFVCLSVRRSVCMSVCLSVCLSICRSVCLSVDLYVCLSVCLSFCLSVCLSVYKLYQQLKAGLRRTRFCITYISTIMIWQVNIELIIVFH